MSGLCVLGHGRGANGLPLDREAEHGLLLCTWHRRRMDHLTRDIADLWVDLAFILEPGSAPKDDTPRTRHLKASEAPAPANLEALSLRDSRSASAPLPDDPSTPIPAVPAIVASWVLLVAEERPLSATLPKSVLAQLQLLTVHGDWIAGTEWAPDYLTELDELRRALSAAVRDQPFRKVGRCSLPGPEGGACVGDLVKENGSDHIECRSCHARWVTPQEQARLAVVLDGA